MDVQNMFLHEDLNENVYMIISQGLNIPNNDGSLVCKLDKSLYGFTQSSRMWFAKLQCVLTSLHFTPTKSDYALFTRIWGNEINVILAYVDDLLIIGNQLSIINSVKTDLAKYFNIKDLGTLKYFLGLEFTRTKDELFASQQKYALDLLLSTN